MARCAIVLPARAATSWRVAIPWRRPEVTRIQTRAASAASARVRTPGTIRAPTRSASGGTRGQRTSGWSAASTGAKGDQPRWPTARLTAFPTRYAKVPYVRPTPTAPSSATRAASVPVVEVGGRVVRKRFSRWGGDGGVLPAAVCASQVPGRRGGLSWAAVWGRFFYCAGSGSTWSTSAASAASRAVTASVRVGPEVMR